MIKSHLPSFFFLFFLETVVVFLCFLLTISTAFEYKLSQKFVYVDPITHQTCSEDRQNKTIAHLNHSHIYEPLASTAAIVATQPLEMTTILYNDDDDADDSTQLSENFNETTIDDDLCERVSFFFVLGFAKYFDIN